MQKWQLAAIISGIAIMIALTCGCISQASPQQPAPATPSEIPVVTPTPASTVLPVTTPTVKPTYTSIPIQTAQVIYYDVNGNQIDHPIEVTTGSTASTTTAISTGALEAPVHLKSKLPPDGKISFTTVRPGKVKISVYCMTPAKAVLTSATTMDQVLVQAKGSPGDSKVTTLNTAIPQTYWITISGFNKVDIGRQTMWAVDVTNA